MFFKEDLSGLEHELGADVFEISKLINAQSETIQKVQSVLCKHQKNPSETKNDQIARILAVYAWALKISGKGEEEVIGCLNIAVKQSNTTIVEGLCSYVNSTVVRGYVKLSESQLFADKMLKEHFIINSPRRAHALNCLALSLMRQQKMKEAEEALKQALAIDVPDAKDRVSQIIGKAEGNHHERTIGNLAQLYAQTNRLEQALAFAQRSLDSKIRQKRSGEDIAYAQIVVGEILIKLNKSAEAQTLLSSANDTYTGLCKSSPAANHLRALVGLTEACQMQKEYEKSAIHLELAKDFSEQLGLADSHDFMRRIRDLESAIQVIATNP